MVKWFVEQCKNYLVTCFLFIYQYVLSLFVGLVQSDKSLILLPWTVCMTVDSPFSCTALTVQGFVPSAVETDRVLLTAYAHPVLLTLRLPAFLFLSHTPGLRLRAICHTKKTQAHMHRHRRLQKLKKKKGSSYLMSNVRHKLSSRFLAHLLRSGAFFILKWNSHHFFMWLTCLRLVVIDALFSTY